MTDLKYMDILRLNAELTKSMGAADYKVSVLSNIITSQLNEILEYNVRTSGINTKVTAGEYDNILQESIAHKDAHMVIIFWEAANLINGFHYKANLFTEVETEEFLSKLFREIDFVFANLENTPVVICNRFSSLVFDHNNLRKSNFESICERLNQHLEKAAGSNTILIDLSKIFSQVSIAKSVDLRYYYSSKSLYTIEFYKAYAKFILPVFAALNGKAKKALIFDCDNTLWKGILGEDGPEKIAMSANTREGVVFNEVQHLAKSLSQKGVLIGLCSKNNPGDVESVLTDHADVTLRNDSISVKKINWEDKVTNLKAIAAGLNIGLDSMVFVDDSDFEAGFVSTELPDVTVVKVPHNLYEYPQLIRNSQVLFYNVSESKEDGARAAMYKQQQQRSQGKEAFSNLESYLGSLGLTITIYSDPLKSVARISQLTQKTNQFNVTTRRYTEADISAYMKSDGATVFAIGVQDKYGDSGLTGVAIVRREQQLAEIDSFLLSCRVIGRNIEFAFMNVLVENLKQTGSKKITASYIKTLKNGQVSDFFEAAGFTCNGTDVNKKMYELNTDEYLARQINYIDITHGTEN